MELTTFAAASAFGLAAKQKLASVAASGEPEDWQDFHAPAVDVAAVDEASIQRLRLS